MKNALQPVPQPVTPGSKKTHAKILYEPDSKAARGGDASFGSGPEQIFEWVFSIVTERRSSRLLQPVSYVISGWPAGRPAAPQPALQPRQMRCSLHSRSHSLYALCAHTISPLTALSLSLSVLCAVRFVGTQRRISKQGLKQHAV